MAVDFNENVKRTSEYLAFPEDIEVPANLNGRHDLPDITDLIASILKHGQLQPVAIRKSGKTPVLAAGFSRWRAVSEINAQGLAPVKLKLRCAYTQLTEEQAFLANIAENRVRNATTPLDDAYNIQRLINVYQRSEKEAAETYGVAVPWIRERLSLLELTPEAEKAVRSGRVKPSAAKEIAKLSRAQQNQVVKREGTITRADVVAPKPAKLFPVDPVLLRLLASLFEDTEGLLDMEQKWIECDRLALKKLNEYYEKVK